MAYQANYRYQVAVIGKYNQSQTRLLLCSGGIISDFFVLSSAQCFVGPFNRFKTLRFYIIVGLVTLTNSDTLTKEIRNIYVYGERSFDNKDDIAILELSESLNLSNFTYLSSLDLPPKNQKFDGQKGSVAGYGATKINRVTNIEIRKRNRVTGNSLQNLTYATVDIAKGVECMQAYRFIHPDRDMCGVIRPNYAHRLRGLCTHDDGAPLVIDNTIVGIAYRNRKDCDDTLFGSLYTNVSFFIDFILGVLSGNLVPNTVVYPNRPHYESLTTFTY